MIRPFACFSRLTLFLCGYTTLDTLRFLEVNDAAVARYGYSRDEFLGLRITDIRPAEDLPLSKRTFMRGAPAWRNPGPGHHLTRDGHIILVHIRSHLLSGSGRHAALVLAEDITERLTREEALRESQEQFRTAFEQAPLACV